MKRKKREVTDKAKFEVEPPEVVFAPRRRGGIGCPGGASHQGAHGQTYSLVAGTHRRGSIPRDPRELRGSKITELKAMPLAMPSSEAHRSVANLCLEIEHAIALRPDFRRFDKPIFATRLFC